MTDLSLVETRSSLTPAPAPWPVAVLSLGRFEVLLRGRPITFRRKVPRRPLELLMALVALGGREVPAERIADALWPDADAPWAVPLRERLRARFLRLVAETGRRLSPEQDRDAIEILERGLEADPLAEDLYREMIRRHAAAGRRAEALSAYHRCERALASLLGIARASDTRALCHALRQGLQVA